jgi:hypothetical protein
MDTKKDKTRGRVRHVFGSFENEQGGIFIPTIDQVRSALKNRAYEFNFEYEAEG